MQTLTKSSWSAVLTRKVDLRTQSVIREREDHVSVIKGSIYHGDTTILNPYAPDAKISMDIKQKLEGERYANDTGRLNTPFSVVDRLHKQQKHQYKCTRPIGLHWFCRTFHPLAAK